MRNLDMIAAQKAQDIVETTKEKNKPDVENLVTKALGVLQEQGVYAGMLYILSRGSEKKENGLVKKNDERIIAEAVRDQLVAILADTGLAPFGLSFTGDMDDRQKLLKHFAGKVCAAPIHTLVLVKNLFEQTLMYARYSVKARSD